MDMHEQSFDGNLIQVCLLLLLFVDGELLLVFKKGLRGLSLKVSRKKNIAIS